MRHLTILLTICTMFINSQSLSAHCQMPCGIYHDQMVYEKIDEFFQTMIKCDSYLNDSKFDTVNEKNQFVRWIYTKEIMCDETAHLICTYFLQQKIKPDEEETTELLKSAHKLLFCLVRIKQTTNLNVVKDFGTEWEHFKQLFHKEDACREAARLLKELTTPDTEDEHEHAHIHGIPHKH